MSARLVHILNGMVLALLLIGSALVYSDLPDRIPVHYDLGGVPDRWSDRTPLAWFGLPLVAFGVTALLYGIGLAMPRNPRLLNLPDRERFLQLPADEQRRIMSIGAQMLYWLAAINLIGFTMIQFVGWQTAIGVDRRWPIVAAGVFIVAGSLAIAVALLVRIQSAITRATRAG